MIEDMYKEETGDAEMDSNSSSDNVPRSKDEIGSSEEREDLKSSATERGQTSQFNESKANNSEIDMGGAAIGFPSETTADDSFMNLMLKDQRLSERDSGLLHDAVGQKPNESGRFMAYQMANLGNLASLGNYGNGSVSLTLGLQHFDGALHVPNAQEAFSEVRGEDIYGSAPQIGVSSSEFDSMNPMDQRQRFEPSPLLHDFVA